jgi:hypothetical protein
MTGITTELQPETVPAFTPGYLAQFTVAHQIAARAPVASATPAPDPRRRNLCRHIHTAGNRCGSPALRGENFCYYHHCARPPMAITGRAGIFTMPRIDDPAAVQIALFEVLSRLSSGDIDYKRGAILLQGLGIASINLRRAVPAQPAAEAPPLVEEIVTDFHLGTLAPIAEIPQPSQDEPVAPEVGAGAPDQAAHLATEMRVASEPQTPTPPAPHPAPTEAVILSEARSAQPEDPDAPSPVTVAPTLPAPTPRAPDSTVERFDFSLPQPHTATPETWSPVPDSGSYPPQSGLSLPPQPV